MNSSRLKLMIEISKLYYLDGLSQNEISKKMYISRPQVSRILSEAREKNIVSITVNDPFSEEYRIANFLKNKYKLLDVMVIDTTEKDPLKEIAEQISRIISSKVCNGDYIGISAGKTIAACSRYTMIHNSKDVKFIPLLAGATSYGVDWYANNNCRRFSERLSSEHMILNIPLIIREKSIRDKLINNPGIKPVFDAYEKLDIIIMGIGQITEDSSLRKCGISNEEILNANKNGAKTIVLGSLIDKEGKEILQDKTEIFLGAKVKHMEKCPCVIAVAEGMRKIESIHYALKGEFIDIFCTNLETAKALIKLR